jgi:hypothetical protein
MGASMSLSDPRSAGEAFRHHPTGSSQSGSTFTLAVATTFDAAEQLLKQGGEIPEDAVRRLLSVAVRLYAALAEETGLEPLPTEPSVSATDAVVTAVALLRAQNLNAFETALWFARTARRS